MFYRSTSRRWWLACPPFLALDGATPHLQEQFSPARPVGGDPSRRGGGSSQPQRGGGDPSYRDVQFHMETERFVVIYDSRSVGKDVYGHVGGSEPKQLRPPISRTRFADFVLECPSCLKLVVSGQLVCLACNAIFLFQGEGRYYSPVLIEFVEITNVDIHKTVSLSPVKQSWKSSPTAA